MGPLNFLFAHQLDDTLLGTMKMPRMTVMWLLYTDSLGSGGGVVVRAFAYGAKGRRIEWYQCHASLFHDTLNGHRAFSIFSSFLYNFVLSHQSFFLFSVFLLNLIEMLFKTHNWSILYSVQSAYEPQAVTNAFCGYKWFLQFLSLLERAISTRRKPLLYIQSRNVKN